MEKRLGIDAIVALGVDKEMLEMIIKKIYANQFKRKMPVIAKLTSRTINHDFNYARDINL